MIEEYPKTFDGFVRTKLSRFWGDLKDFYQERGGNPDSLSYFVNHYPRFRKMIEICEGAGLSGASMQQVCELGSWYPYTTYYFKGGNPDLKIDLFDIVPRFLLIATYDVDGVRLIDHNLCTEELPNTQYDLTILSEVMEHLPIDLFAFEKRVIEVVRPGGHLVVTYPLGGRNARDYEKTYEDRDMHSLQEDHVREFTRATVPFFFKGLEMVATTDVKYPAYGLIQICLYRKAL